MRNSLRAFSGLLRYHRAYLVMLMRSGLLKSADARVLIRALRALHAKGLPALCLDPSQNEELQPAVEAWLIQNIGVEKGGQLVGGRSRQECQLVAEQITLRDALLSLIEKVIALGAQSDSFHLPETAGLMGHVLKHVPRLLMSYREVNKSRAGVGSVVPTSLRINRPQLARLLGFRGCIQNSMYGYSAFDIEIALLNNLTLMAADLYRFSLGLPVQEPASHRQFIKYIELTSHEAQRLYLTASNLYLDTTPMIRGAITVCTYDCILMLDRMETEFLILAHMMRSTSAVKPQPQAGSKGSPARAGGWRRPLAPFMRCVSSETMRLGCAEIELERQIQAAAGKR